MTFIMDINIPIQYCIFEISCFVYVLLCVVYHIFFFLSVDYKIIIIFYLRDERVKHKVLRIFKIWEQRGIYNEEFIADLSGLISATPAKKSDDPHEFQVKIENK